MGLRRLRAAGTVVVVTVVLVVAACTGDVDPPDDPERPPESAALRVQAVTGADRLDERTRAEIEGEVGEVLSAYIVSAFLGTFPRQRFVDSFATFTSGAAEDATRDIEWLTASTAKDATSVRATELDTRLSLLTQGGTVHGGTARVHFVFEATMPDGSTRSMVLDGKFLLVADGDTFTIFGYRMAFDNGVDEPAEVDGGTETPS